jgi:hypothetical protein
VSLLTLLLLLLLLLVPAPRHCKDSTHRCNTNAAYSQTTKTLK